MKVTKVCQSGQRSGKIAQACIANHADFRVARDREQQQPEDAASREPSSTVVVGADPVPAMEFWPAARGLLPRRPAITAHVSREIPAGDAQIASRC